MKNIRRTKKTEAKKSETICQDKEIVKKKKKIGTNANPATLLPNDAPAFVFFNLFFCTINRLKR